MGLEVPRCTDFDGNRRARLHINFFLDFTKKLPHENPGSSSMLKSTTFLLKERTPALKATFFLVSSTENT
jgi:hypothetical protein